MVQTNVKNVWKCPVCNVIENKGRKMNIEKLREELKIDEGVKYEVYLDHLGSTCGIGHLIKDMMSMVSQLAQQYQKKELMNF